MLIIAAFDTVKGIKHKLFSRGEQLAPARLGDTQTILLDNGDLLIPDGTGHLFAIGRETIGGSVFTRVCAYRSLPPNMRFRQSEYLGLAFWLQDCLCPGELLFDVLTQGVEAYAEAMTNSGRDLWTVDRLNLATLRISQDQITRAEGECRPLPAGAGINARREGTSVYFFCGGAAARSSVAAAIDIAQTDPAFARYSKVFATSDERITAAMRDARKAVIPIDDRARLILPPQPRVASPEPDKSTDSDVHRGALQGGDRLLGSRSTEFLQDRTRILEKHLTDHGDRVGRVIDDIGRLKVMTKRLTRYGGAMVLSALAMSCAALALVVLDTFTRGDRPMPTITRDERTTPRVAPQTAGTLPKEVPGPLSPCPHFETRILETIDLLERPLNDLAGGRRGVDFVNTTVPIVRQLLDLRQRCTLGNGPTGGSGQNAGSALPRGTTYPVPRPDAALPAN